MFSWVAIDRFAEKERAIDAKFRKQNADKVLRSDAKPLTDDELLAKLRSFDIELDRPWLERHCREALSAEEIATPLLDQRTFHGRQGEMESDWIWVCLTTLWQRWFPDQPCFELLDDKIEAGYDLQGSAACHIWLEAWKDVLGLLDKGGLTSIRAFDERFRGSQSLFNWIQDLEDALWNAGLEDRQFLTARIAVCEEGLRRFPAEDELMSQNRRRALAESYFEVGETAKAEALYRDWLQADPRWGWGWIGWSDGYGFTRTQLQDWPRAEQILLSGLATILFLLMTRGRVPSYLGTSASFVGVVAAVRADGGKSAEVTGAIAVSGVVLALVGLAVHLGG